MTVKQEILKELNATADKLEVELTREINSLGSYGLALVILNKTNSKQANKLAKAIKSIHDTIHIVHNME